MPKDKKPVKQETLTKHDVSHEATAYLQGLFQELQQQMQKYSELTGSLLNLEARIELAEKTLCLTRNHFEMAIKRTDSVVPHDWSNTFGSVRFVGVRLADACKALLQEHKKMTPHEILVGLNKGMFRFRTNSPLREIHAALLRQTFAKKSGENWVWTGGEEQMSLRPRLMMQTPITGNSMVTKEKEKASK